MRVTYEYKGHYIATITTTSTTTKKNPNQGQLVLFHQSDIFKTKSNPIKSERTEKRNRETFANPFQGVGHQFNSIPNSI